MTTYSQRAPFYNAITTVALRDQNEVRETTVHAGTVVVYVYVAGLRWWTR